MKFQEEITASYKKIIAKHDFKPVNLLSIDDLSNKDIDVIMELASYTEDILKGDQKKVTMLKGKTQLNFFMENSTRTRTSFELAGKNLGADVINISASASSMSKGETLLDTAVTLDQMQADVIVTRAGSAGVPHFIAKNVKASVINAGDGWNEHPTQALLDLLTLRRKLGKNLKGKKMVMVGDTMHSRVFGSWARLAAKIGIDLTVCAPHTLVQPDIDQWGVKHESDINKALKGADIIYVLRLQTERASAAFVPTLREYSKTYIVNAARVRLAKPNVVVMHPGPVIREFDLHTNVLETDASLVPEQVFSGYCVRFVLLWLFSFNRKNKKIEPRLYKKG